MEAVLAGLIWLLIYALIVAIVCFIVTRIMVQFLPGAAAWTWVIWCIGGLILLILALRLLAPLLP